MVKNVLGPTVITPKKKKKAKLKAQPANVLWQTMWPIKLMQTREQPALFYFWFFDRLSIF